MLHFHDLAAQDQGGTRGTQASMPGMAIEDDGMRRHSTSSSLATANGGLATEHREGCREADSDAVMDLRIRKSISFSLLVHQLQECKALGSCDDTGVARSSRSDSLTTVERLIRRNTSDTSRTHGERRMTWVSVRSLPSSCAYRRLRASRHAANPEASSDRRAAAAGRLHPRSGQSIQAI